METRGARDLVEVVADRGGCAPEEQADRKNDEGREGHLALAQRDTGERTEERAHHAEPGLGAIGKKP